MDIIVCVKRVPDTAGAEVRIAEDGQRIREEELVFDLNEWDKYAVEEAVRLKGKHGGTLTAITLGPEDADDALRRCFVTGCDRGVRLTDDAFTGSDATAIASILHRVIKDTKFDLILTGVQASDDGYGQVGPTLAQLLGIPCAGLITHIEILDGKARVKRELEGGLEEEVEIKLPAVLTIQTGINEPRYVSIRALMKVAEREITGMNREALGMSRNEVGEAGSRTRIEGLFLPPPTKEVEILPGEPEAATARLVEILKNKGMSV
ncbi:electron transfer flavoprotein subunit beta/FixA family protein [Chloroflexota bacterium]